MKPLKFLLMALVMVVSMSSCAKVPDSSTIQQVTEISTDMERSWTADSVEFYLSQPAQYVDCFEMSDLLTFQQFYAYGASDAPAKDVIPCFNNYQQDIAGGFNPIGNYTVVDGVRIDTLTLEEQEAFNWRWYWSDGESPRYLIATGFNPLYNIIDLECDGGGYLTLQVEDKANGILYERSVIAYIDYNGIENCDNGISPFDTFAVISTVPPSGHSPHDMMIFPWEYDFNSDTLISVSDLRSLLPGMC